MRFRPPNSCRGAGTLCLPEIPKCLRLNWVQLCLLILKIHSTGNLSIGIEQEQIVQVCPKSHDTCARVGRGQHMRHTGGCAGTVRQLRLHQLAQSRTSPRTRFATLLRGRLVESWEERRGRRRSLSEMFRCLRSARSSACIYRW